MAYVAPEDEEQGQGGGMDVLGGQQGQAPEGPVQVSGTSGTVGAGGAAPAAPVPGGGGQAQTAQQAQGAPQQANTKRQKGSGMFTDIRRYVDANKPQTGRLAGAVGRGVTGQAEAVRKQLEQQKGQFQRLSGSEKSRLAGAKEFTQQAVQQAGSGQLTDPQFQRYQNIASGQTRFDSIKAPDFSKQKAKTEALSKLAGGARQSEGRKALLREAFGRDQKYTRGQRAIDALLLSRSPDAIEQIETTAQAPITSLQDQMGTARQSALQELQGLRTDTQQFVGREGQAFKDIAGQEGARTTLQKELETTRAAEVDRLSKRRDELSEKLRTGQFLTKEDFADLEVPEERQGELQALVTTKAGGIGKYGMEKFLEPFDDKLINLRSVATDEQSSRYDALSKLIGQSGLEATPQAKALRFNYKDAFADALSQSGIEGVEFTPEQGFVGSAAQIAKFRDFMLETNPLLAGPMMIIGGPIFAAGAAVGGALKAADEIGSTVGMDIDQAQSEAIKGAGNIIDAQLDIGKTVIEDPTQLLTPSFYLDTVTKNIINTAGQTVQSAAEIATRLTPDAVPGMEAVDAFINGGAAAVVTVVNRVKSAAAAAARAAKRIFCFAADTPIRLADGTTKPVQELTDLDETYLGGWVIGAGFICTDELYEYKGLYSSGDHGYFIDGEWKRAHEVGTLVEGESKVYPVATVNHLLVTGDIISTDTTEIDDCYGKTNDEILEALNSNTIRNKWLVKVQEELNEDRKIPSKIQSKVG